MTTFGKKGRYFFLCILSLKRKTFSRISPAAFPPQVLLSRTGSHVHVLPEREAGKVILGHFQPSERGAHFFRKEELGLGGRAPAEPGATTLKYIVFY